MFVNDYRTEPTTSHRKTCTDISHQSLKAAGAEHQEWHRRQRSAAFDIIRLHVHQPYHLFSRIEETSSCAWTDSPSEVRWWCPMQMTVCLQPICHRQDCTYAAGARPPPAGVLLEGARHRGYFQEVVSSARRTRSFIVSQHLEQNTSAAAVGRVRLEAVKLNARSYPYAACQHATILERGRAATYAKPEGVVVVRRLKPIRPLIKV